jgi:ABC-type phosphate transport system substrate-binding protein
VPRILATILVLLLSSGCSRERVTPPTPDPVPTLKLSVSRDVGLLVERWTRALPKAADIELHTSMTTDALAYAALLEGQAQAAVVHRRANPAEVRRAKGDDIVVGEPFTYVEVGVTPITLLVHADNPVEVVTVEQAAGLLGGWVMSWSEVGGQALTIERFVREADTATWATIDEWLGESAPARGQSLPDARAVATAVKTTSASLGTGGGAPGPGVRPLGLRLDTGDLIMPGSATQSGAVWPLQRPLLLVTRGGRTSALEAWLAGVSSDEGRAIAEQNGYALTGGAR